MNEEKKVIVVLGPTASGKTAFAVELAGRLRTAIVSADSRQVYRGCDIGSGKELSEYTYQGQPVPYHLIDIAEPNTRYDLNAYIKDVGRVLEEMYSRQQTPLICGGSGLYIESILGAYQMPMVPESPELRVELGALTLPELTHKYRELGHPIQTFTPDFSTKKRAIRAIEIGHWIVEGGIEPKPGKRPRALIFGMKVDTRQRWAMIHDRLIRRLNEGMIEETDVLRRRYGDEAMIRLGLEYRFITEYLQGKCSRETMVEQLETAIRQFSKRQMTYFRKMERDGYPIQWVDPVNDRDRCYQRALVFVNESAH